MRDVIAFILGNFTLTFFVAGLLASAIALWRARPPRSSALIVEALFSYFVLFSIGFSNLYNFVLHVFFGKLAASFIGWEDSPFQLEVGFASLGFAVVGLLAVRGSFDLRLAAIVGPAGFLWGCLVPEGSSANGCFCSLDSPIGNGVFHVKNPTRGIVRAIGRGTGGMNSFRI